MATSLTAYIVETGEFVQVPAKEVYDQPRPIQQRSQSGFVGSELNSVQFCDDFAHHNVEIVLTWRTFY